MNWKQEYCILDETDILLDKNGSLTELEWFFQQLQNLNTIIKLFRTITDNYLVDLNDLEIIKNANENDKHKSLLQKLA